MSEARADLARQRMREARDCLAQHNLSAASAVLQAAALHWGREGDSRSQAQILKLVGLLFELLGDRAEAGVHYCCAMRIASRNGNERFSDSLCERLSYLSRPWDEVPFFPPGAGAEASDHALRQVSGAIAGRLEMISGDVPAGLRAVLQSIREAPRGSAVLDWWVDELQCASDAQSDGALRQMASDMSDTDLVKELRARDLL